MPSRINGLRTQLLLGSALATAMMGYGLRRAYAGACTGGGGVYSCTGAANAVTDVSQVLNPGSALTVTTSPGFGIDTSTNAPGSAAFDLTGTGGLSFTDNNASQITADDNAITANNTGGALSVTTTGHVSSVNSSGVYATNAGTSLTISTASVSGSYSGITVLNEGSGATSVTATGAVSGSGYVGIDAYNDVGATSLTINVSDVTGGLVGIAAGNSGSGPTSVTATGTVSGSGFSGIIAFNSGIGESGEGLTISVNDVNGNYQGITAYNLNGAATITATGTVSGTGFDGILARNQDTGTNLTISAHNVSGGYDGIAAYNEGSGALSVTATGSVTGTEGSGIYVRNEYSGTSLTISAHNVSGGYDGITATNVGTGALSVTATGLVEGTAYNGIFAVNSPYGTALTVEATGGVTGGGDGITAYNYGTGALSVTTTGTVTGVTDDGIETFNDTNGTNLTISAENVTAGDSGIKADNAGTGFVNVSVSGSVIAGDEGIEAYNSSAGTSLTISANHVTSVETAIRAANYGSGPTSVTVTGTVAGGLLDYYGGPAFGIQTITGAGGNTTINLNSGADVSAASGIAIVNDDGNSTTNVNAGASVTGAIQLGGGSDALVFDGGNFSAVTQFDGGGGGNDTLTFRNTAGNVDAANVIAMDKVTVGSGANINIAGTLQTDMLQVDSGGTVSAGASPGLMQVLGDAAFLGGSKLLVELGGLAFGAQYDRVDVADDVGTGTVEGTATLADGTIFDIDWFGGFTAGLGDSFDVLVADNIALSDLGALLFDFSDAALSLGLTWQTSVVAFGSGRQALRLTVISDNVAAAPEPSSTLLLAAGVLGIVGFRRARRRPQVGASNRAQTV